MIWLIALGAVIAGCLNTVQSGANATLNKTLQQPIFSALVVSGTNVIVYLLFAIFVGLSLPEASRVSQTPWWAWMGGALGAIYVLSMILFAERLGAAVFTGLTLTGAIVTSVILDHYGLVGFRQHEVSLLRIVGCFLMIGGLALISKF